MRNFLPSLTRQWPDSSGQLSREVKSAFEVNENQRKQNVYSLLFQQGWRSDNILAASELRNEILKAKGSKKQFHIIASGHSTLSSFYKCDPQKHFIVGFNYASLLPITFDCYFVEMASNETDYLFKYSEIQKHVIHSAKKIDLLILKNIWQKKIEQNYALDAYGNNVKMLLDIHAPFSCDGDQHILKPYQLSKLLLKTDKLFAMQLYTTAFTCIALAYQCGFREVILHGLDLGGPHFYIDSSIRWPRSADSDTVDEMISKSMQHDNDPNFLGGLNKLRTLMTLMSLRDNLAHKGIRLLVASQQSPIAQYLDCWI